MKSFLTFWFTQNLLPNSLSFEILAILGGFLTKGLYWGAF
eukprot:UN21854